MNSVAQVVVGLREVLIHSIVLGQDRKLVVSVRAEMFPKSEDSVQRRVLLRMRTIKNPNIYIIFI
jgi:hypothetical protein